MSKKGVSAEEKRNRMLQLFYEKGECFQLKELEKIAPKEKGIVANSVKDVVQKLLEDGLIDSDKIGTSVYFWSFPSKAMNIKKRKLEELKNNYDQSVKKFKLIQQSLAEAEESKDETNKKKKLLENISDKELKVLEMKKQLKMCVENDSGRLESQSNKSEELKNAANRWTDNVFAVKSWCKKKFFMEDSTLNKQFGIPEDFDYLE